jgi:nitrite reductase/ring-hydroxylating ferredoxin subunit
VLPAAPRSWYFVCRSRDLGSGRIVPWSLLDTHFVLYRGQSGRVFALDAHCPHMGAHLAQGHVIGDRLRCAMHHWVLDASGTCRGPGGSCLPHNTYAVVEQYGGIFICVGAHETFPLPVIPDDDGRSLHVVMGEPETVETSWPGIMANAFDTEHILAVHHRALLEQPTISQLGAHGIELRYASRVTGRGASDRAMKWLSNDRILVTICCWGGTVMTVRSEVGSRIGRLLVSVTPSARGAVVTPFVAVPKSHLAPLDALSARLSLWLFTTFLRRDLLPLKHMDFRLEGALQSNGPVADLAAWLLTLPGVRSRFSDDQHPSKGVLAKIEI